MNQDMLVVNAEAVERSENENKDVTCVGNDSCTEDHMTSINLRYAKNCDYSAGNYGTYILEEHLTGTQVQQAMKLNSKNACDTTESCGQRENGELTISVEDRNTVSQYMSSEVLVNGRTSASSLVNGTSIDTCKSICNTISLNDRCGNGVVAEIISKGQLRKNCISSSQFRDVISESGTDNDLSTFSILNQTVIHKGDDMCNRFNEPTMLTFGALEGSCTETDDNHKAITSIDTQHDHDTKGLPFFQHNSENVDVDVAINTTTMQQTSIDINQMSNKVDDRAQTTSKANGNSEIICYQKVNFDGTHVSEKMNSTKFDQSKSSKLLSANVTNSVFQDPDLEDMSDNIVNNCELPSAPLQRAITRAEPPFNATFLKNSMTSNDVLKQTISIEPVYPQDCNVSKLSVLSTKENKAMLNFLKQNGITASEHGGTALSGNSCKIVTKYVYIKSPKLKSGKKNLGVLYKQAFKHYYRTKLRVKRKKKKPIVREKKTKIKSSTNKIESSTNKIESSTNKIESSSNKKAVIRKSKIADFMIEENALRQKGREDRNKSREERRLARELKKDIRKDLNERKKQNKGPKRKDNESERTSSKKGGTNSSKKEKKRHNFSKTVHSKGKFPLLENIGKSFNTVRTENGFSTKQAWRNLNKKEKITDKTETRILSGSKRNKKQRKIILENDNVEIKEEIADEENHQLNDETEDPDDCTQQRKSKMRNRKDLTLQEKVQAIGALEIPGSKLVAVAKRFGVSVSAISRINKNKEYILLQSVSGDLNNTQRRSRECKDPELDKVLLKWFRAIENLHSGGTSVVISNVLLKEKVHELAITMGKNYFPSDNWIIRWKNRHNIGVKSNSMSVVIQDRDELKLLDGKVNISEVLEEMGKQESKIDQVKRESIMRHREKPEELFICEHCGVLTSTKKKKENNHLAGCPASSVRKDLTLEEKVQVVRALEQPGVKMVTLAKKYGVSASAVSRIHKNRVDILARRASGLANSARRRDRGSKEPEVEKMLCEWFKVQHELGIHISGSMIREKARDIAKVLGKDFWPSESWVFRWRHRNNVTDINTFLYGDSDEGDLGGLEKCNDHAEMNVTFPNSSEGDLADKSVESKKIAVAGANEETQDKKRQDKTIPDGSAAAKQFRLPRSVMCEKCGFVSCRVKNNRIKSLRHAKGCPDLKPRNELTYENRARMLKALEEPGATLSSVARQFGVSVSSMSRMNQKKDQILSHSEDHASQKRIRDCKEPEVAYDLYQWYMEKKAEGVHVTGPKLKEKARSLAAQMGREFSASSGWLGRWRHRYNIMGSLKTVEKISRDPMAKRKPKRDNESKMDSSEQLTQLQAMNHELHQDSLGSAGSVIVEPLEPMPQPSQTAPIFIHQRFQNPWEISQQQAESCVWTKEFLSQAGSGVLDEAAVSVAYTYGDTVSKPVFHNMFDSFSAIGYQVAMPLDSSMVLGREYLKSDINEDKCALPGGHLPHSSHSQHSHHLPTTQQHLQHHLTVTHPHSLTHSQQSQIQVHPQITHSLPSPAALDDDPEEQRQVMEAYKIMSSYAQKKSLGEQFQAALRTFEMSMKSTAGKTTSRNTYTSM